MHAFLLQLKPGVVVEFIDGQDLQSYLLSHGGSLTEEVARFVFQQLCITVREPTSRWWWGEGSWHAMSARAPHAREACSPALKQWLGYAQLMHIALMGHNCILSAAPDEASDLLVCCMCRWTLFIARGK